MIRDRLKANPLPIQWPIGSESDFRGIVDLLTMEASIWREEDLGAVAEVVEIPEEVRPQVEAARERIMENIIETDDELMTRYLDGDEISAEELRSALTEGHDRRSSNAGSLRVSAAKQGHPARYGRGCSLSSFTA